MVLAWLAQAITLEGGRDDFGEDTSGCQRASICKALFGALSLQFW